MDLSNIISWSLIGTSAVMLGVGGYFTYAWTDLESQVAADTDAWNQSGGVAAVGTGGPEAIQARHEESKSHQITALTTITLGVAALTTGVILLTLGDDAPSSASVRIQPVIGPTSAGLLGRF
jgi:hypothetical protein